MQQRCSASLGGWMTVAERQKLFEIAKAMPTGGRFVEIGVYGGTNLALFALLRPDVEVIGIDSWENKTEENLYAFCVRNLVTAGVQDAVKLIGASSHAVGPTWDLPIDVLIIDGDHLEAGAYQDLIDFAPHVKPGGLLIMDDYVTDGTPHEGVGPAFDKWWSHSCGEWTIIWGNEKRHDERGNLVNKFIIVRRAGIGVG